MKAVTWLLRFSLLLLVGCSGMSYDPYDQTKWQAKIYSNPPGAEIYVDGVPVGNAPLEYSYPSVGMAKKEVVAKFPSGNEQSVLSGYYIFEIFFDFINGKATIKEYPEALSLFAETREVSFAERPPPTSEMLQHALSGFEEMRAMLSGGGHLQPSGPPKPPEISVGPEIEILRAESGSERVKVIADREGQARVLVASEELRQVLDISVGPQGVAKRQVIRSGVYPKSIEAAFDSQGRLHLLLDDEHLVLEDDIWQECSRAPWQESGLEVRGARFVPGAPELTWAFQMDGAAFDAPVRMDIYGFGGYGAGIIWPWFTHGSRTVLVSEVAGGYGPWVVLDPRGKESTFARGLASDRLGNAYLIYEKSRGGLAASSSSCYYLRVDSEALRGEEVSLPGVEEIHVGKQRIRALGKGLARLAKGAERGGGLIATDPQSGTALVGMRFLVNGKTWSAPKEWPFSTDFFLSAVAAGGQDTFHGLVVGEPRDFWWGKDFPIYYLMFSNGAWSTAEEVGLGNVKSFWGYGWGAIGLAAVGSEKVFLVWPTEQGVVGRWITVVDMPQ